MRVFPGVQKGAKIVQKLLDSENELLVDTSFGEDGGFILNSV